MTTKQVSIIYKDWSHIKHLFQVQWYGSGNQVYKKRLALAGWLNWLECCPVHQMIAGSIPHQGTYLGYSFVPCSGGVHGAADQCVSTTSMFLSLFLSFPSSLSLKSVNMSLGKDWEISGQKIQWKFKKAKLEISEVYVGWRYDTRNNFFLNFLLLFNYSCVPFLPIPPPHPSRNPHPPPTPPSPLIWSMCPLK